MSASEIDRYLAALRRVADNCNVECRPATPDELSKLIDLGVRPAVLDCMGRGVLTATADSCVRVHDPETIAYEHEMLCPGEEIGPKGFVVIGSAHCGDVFALDFNQCDSGGQPPVFLVSHEDNWESASAQSIADGSRRIADSYAEFLEGVADEKYQKY